MRSFISPEVRGYAVRCLRVAGGGLLTLLISAILISFRILACDDTDLFWDHPSMFFDIVALAYSDDGRSEWGPLWDLAFAIIPMWVYVAVFAEKLWDPDDDEYAPYRRAYWDEIKRLVPPEPPAFEWGYEEYEVTRPEEPVHASRTPTLPGFPAPRPPGQPIAKIALTQREIDEGWEG